MRAYVYYVVSEPGLSIGDMMHRNPGNPSVETKMVRSSARRMAAHTRVSESRKRQTPSSASSHSERSRSRIVMRAKSRQPPLMQLRNPMTSSEKAEPTSSAARELEQAGNPSTSSREWARKAAVAQGRQI